MSEINRQLEESDRERRKVREWMDSYDAGAAQVVLLERSVNPSEMRLNRGTETYEIRLFAHPGDTEPLSTMETGADGLVVYYSHWGKR